MILRAFGFTRLVDYTLGHLRLRNVVPVWLICTPVTRLPSYTQLRFVWFARLIYYCTVYAFGYARALFASVCGFYTRLRCVYAVDLYVPVYVWFALILLPVTVVHGCYVCVTRLRLFPGCSRCHS